VHIALKYAPNSFADDRKRCNESYDSAMHSCFVELLLDPSIQLDLLPGILEWLTNAFDAIGRGL
jgi:hypothetical protein